MMSARARFVFVALGTISLAAGFPGFEACLCAVQSVQNVRVMLRDMLPASYYDKILWSIVIFYAVGVVNNFTRLKNAPKLGLHYKTMLRNIAIRIGTRVLRLPNQLVSFAVIDVAFLVLSALLNLGALLAGVMLWNIELSRWGALWYAMSASTGAKRAWCFAPLGARIMAANKDCSRAVHWPPASTRAKFCSHIASRDMTTVYTICKV